MSLPAVMTSPQARFYILTTSIVTSPQACFYILITSIMTFYRILPSVVFGKESICAKLTTHTRDTHLDLSHCFEWLLSA